MAYEGTYLKVTMSSGKRRLHLVYSISMTLAVKDALEGGLLSEFGCLARYVLQCTATYELFSSRCDGHCAIDGTS